MTMVNSLFTTSLCRAAGPRAGHQRCQRCEYRRIQPALETGGRKGGDGVRWVKLAIGGIGLDTTRSNGRDHAATGMAAAA
jgi:hypothetical protein